MIEVAIDSQLLHFFTQNEEERALALFLEKTKGSLNLSWPSFLHAIEVDPILDRFPRWHESSALSQVIEKALRQKMDREFLCRLYDQVFVESLTQVKALEEITPNLFLHKIEEKKRSVFAKALEPYKHLFLKEAHATMHDFTLYLAWDRVLVYFASLFDQPLEEGIEDLAVFKECLIESYTHIKSQGKTQPGFFRLLEALYAYDLRQENLQKHSKEHWNFLCKGSSFLKPREQFLSVSYVDLEKNSLALTLDPEEQVLSARNLVSSFSEQEKLDFKIAFSKVFRLEMDSMRWIELSC